MYRITYSALAALVLLITGCAAPAETTPPVVEVRADIEAANERFESYVAAGDAAGVASLYTTDGQLIAPSTEPVTGRANIQTAVESMLQGAPVVIDLETVELETGRNFAYEVGNYTFENEAGEHLDHGRYIVIWKQENGEWKLHRDIFNSSMPQQ